MKISEFIKALEAKTQLHGDIELAVKSGYCDWDLMNPELELYSAQMTDDVETLVIQCGCNR